MNFSEFNDIQNKNWDTIAKLIPGTTPQEVRERSLFMPGGMEEIGGRNIASRCPGPDVENLYELF